VFFPFIGHEVKQNFVKKSKMKPEKDIQYPVLDEIRSRWSGRSFADKVIEKEHIMQLIEAARWAPSSYNEQPWRFIVTEKGTKEFDLLAATLLPGNAPWASEAAILMLTVVKQYFSQNQKPNRFAYHDLGQSVAFMNLQAEKLKINVHQMAGFRKNEAETSFNIPDGFEAVTVIAMGYRGDIGNISPELQQKELAAQSRKDISEIAFFNQHKIN
jgi:nitroreductase